MIDGQRLFDCFIDLARIKSLTYDERGVADYIKGALAALDVEITEDVTGGEIGGNTGNLIVRLGGAEGEPAILLSAHMDTVEPADNVDPVLDGDVISSGGKTILGADDKAGCAVIVELIRHLCESDREHAPLEAVFTVAEEKGLMGSRHLNTGTLTAGYGFVIDGDGPAGTIITKAPYQDYFKAVFTGRAAHAGVEPEKGKSAIKAASKAIAAMRLGRLDDESTANIGVVMGGRAINIVPEHTEIEGEARSHVLSKLKVQVEHMKECVSKASAEEGVRFEVKTERLYDGFGFEPDEPLIKKAEAAARQAGIEPKLMTSGGGSDTNVFNRAGIKSLNISCGQRNVHTTEESVSLSDMVKTVNMLDAILRNTAGESPGT